MSTDSDPRSDKRNAHLQLTLSRELVVSDLAFQRESEKIFSRNWIYICRKSELENTSGCRRFELDGNNLVLILGDDGRVRAFHNFCRHRGSELVTPENCASIQHRIQCPYHAWTYNRSGALVSAPNMTDSSRFDKTQHGLKRVECDVWSGFVFIRLGEGIQSLAEFLSPLKQHAQAWGFEELHSGAQMEYDVRANWKLIFQNYSECYHCPIVHPALNQLTPFQKASNDLEEGPILGGPMQLSSAADSMSMDGKTIGQTLPNLDPTQKKTVAYYTIFPSLFLSAHPDYVLLHRIERMSPSETRVVCQFLFHPDSISAPGFNPKNAIDFWDMTNRQDWEVCELAQRGVASAGFEPGPYSDLESVVAAFDRHYREQLEAPEGFGDNLTGKTNPPI